MAAPRRNNLHSGTGDIETSSSLPEVEDWESHLRDIAAGMLEVGLPVEKVAKMMKISEADVRKILRDLPQATSLLSAGDMRRLEVQLTEYPKKFVCARTGKLMSNPVMDANGNWFECSNSEGQHVPYSYLMEELTEFKKERVDSILAAAPKVVASGFHAEAARLLESAQSIARSIKGGEARLKEVLTTVVRLIGDDRSFTAFVKFMAQHHYFADLARGFQEFRVAGFLAELSSDELRGLFRAFEALEPDDDRKDNGRARVAVGRALLAKLTPEVADARVCAVKGWAGRGETQRVGEVPCLCRTLYWRASALEHVSLLHALYALEPATDFRDQLASAIAFWAPQHRFKEALACLPTPALESAAAQVVGTRGVAAWRSAAILCTAAERSSAPAARTFYRHALSVDPVCARASHGLMSLLLRDLEAGIANPGGNEELAYLLVEHGAFDVFAKHFQAIASSTTLEVSCLDALACEKLSQALLAIGATSEACEVLLAAAYKLEHAGNTGQAFAHFKRVLEWDCRNGAAEAGVKRLSMELGCEWEAAAHLLISLVCHDAEMASRVTGILQLLERSVKQELAATKDKLVAVQRSAEIHMNKELAGIKGELMAMTQSYAEVQINKELASIKDELTALQSSAEVRLREELAATKDELIAMQRSADVQRGKELGAAKDELIAMQASATVQMNVSVGKDMAAMKDEVFAMQRLAKTQLDKDLAATKDELIAMQSSAKLQINKELATTRDELLAAQSDVKAELACAREELAATKDELISMQSAVQVEMDAACAREESAATKGELIAAKREIEQKVASAWEELELCRLTTARRLDTLQMLVKTKADKQQLRFTGFSSAALNGTYLRDDDEKINGRETYRHVNMRFSIYRVERWPMAKWMICSTDSTEELCVLAGEDCSGWARTRHIDPSLAQYWQEHVDGGWAAARVQIQARASLGTLPAAKAG